MRKPFVGQVIPTAKRMFELRHENRHDGKSMLIACANARRRGDRWLQHLLLAQYLGLAK